LPVTRLKRYVVRKWMLAGTAIIAGTAKRPSVITNTSSAAERMG
jgi:hypothetical protein